MALASRKLPQLDHPYDGAYYEAIAELTDEDRKSLLTMAAHGADPDTLFFVSIMIIELAYFNDPACGILIARWISLPAVDSIMPQEAMNIFATLADDSRQYTGRGTSKKAVSRVSPVDNDEFSFFGLKVNSIK